MSHSGILDLDDDARGMRELPTQSSRSGHQRRRRRNHQLDESELEVSPSWLDRTIEWLLIGLLAFMPLALGVVAPWSEMVVVGVTGLIATCVAFRAIRRREGRLIWSWSFLPVGMFVALILLQIIPLPESFVRVASSATIATKHELLGDLPTAQAANSPITLSFYPPGGFADLRLVLVAATLFVSVVQVFQQTAQVRRLLTAIAVIGGGVAALALLQHATGTTKVYWTIPTFAGADGGPFINRNHYAQFASLSVGAALGLLLVRVREELKEHFSVQEVAIRVQEPEFRSTWWLLGVIVLGVVTICLSLSRGGMLSTLIALSFSILVLSARQRMRPHSWVLLLVAAVSSVGVSYAGVDVIVDRFAALGQGDDPLAGRSQVYKDAFVAWKSYPLLGMGQGTWAVTYPMFDRSNNPRLAQHADAEYAQLALEAGAAGILIVLLFIITVWANYFRAVRATRPAICTASVGLGFGLLAVMIQSGTDFGQRIPAVAGLTAVTCGLLVGLGRMARSATPRDAHTPRAEEERALRPAAHARKVIGGAVAGVWVMAMAWSLWSVNTDRVAAAHWDRAQEQAYWLERDEWRGEDDDYTALLSSATAAVDARPGDVEFRYWLNRWRWHAITREGNAVGDIELHSEEMGYVEQIVRELHEARALCPTYAQLYSLAGQLEWFVLDRFEEGARHIRTGHTLFPNEPATCFAAGQLDLESGDGAGALQKFRHCLVLDHKYLHDVVDTCIAAERPHIAVEVARGNPAFLHQVASILKDTEHQALVSDVQSQFLDEMGHRTSDRPAYLLAAAARMHKDKGDLKRAIELYRKAISKDYDQIGLRLDLATALDADGQADAALREARLCIRLRPHSSQARALVEQLSKRSSPGPTRKLAPTTSPSR